MRRSVVCAVNLRPRADFTGVWCNWQHSGFWYRRSRFESWYPSEFEGQRTCPFEPNQMAPLCSGLARRPLKAVARVRIPSGLPVEALACAIARAGAFSSLVTSTRDCALTTPDARSMACRPVSGEKCDPDQDNSRGNLNVCTSVSEVVRGPLQCHLAGLHDSECDRDGQKH